MKTFSSTHAAGAMVIALVTALTACSGGDGGNDASATTAPPGTFRTLSTWAGSPDPAGPDGGDGTGGEVRFTTPQTVDVTDDGSLWVGDTRLRRIDAAGNVTTMLDLSLGSLLAFDVGGRRVLLGFPSATVAAPSGGVFVLMRQSQQLRDRTIAGDGPWAVIHLVPGLPARLAALPAPDPGSIPIASAIALDRQGRLYVASACSILRSDGDVLTNTQPRDVVPVHETSPVCGFLGAAIGVSRLAVDTQDRVLFTLNKGDVQRLEADGRVTALGRTSAGLAYPCGSMAVDAQGGVLLTNGTPALLRLDAQGKEHIVAGSPVQKGWVDGAAERARFGSLCGLAIDAQGRTVLADGANSSIRRIEADGRVVTIAGRPLQWGYRDGIGKDAAFGRNFRVGAGADGGVLVVDTENAALRAVDDRRRVSTLMGVSRTGLPHALAPDGPVASTWLELPIHALRTADGSIWITEYTRVRRVGTDGIIRTVSTPGGSQPHALAIDAGGDVVVAMSTYTSGTTGRGLAHHLERHSTRDPQAAPARLLLSLPYMPEEHASFYGVEGLCALPDGTFVFTQAHAVLRRAADGVATVLAGMSDEPGAADGPGPTARFQQPEGLACDAHGGIYVADYGNHTVRYIDAQRQVRTVLGQAGVEGHRIDTVPGQLNRPRSLVLVPGALIVTTGQGLVRAGF